MLPQMLVCLPRFLTYEVQEQAKLIHSGRRIDNSDCLCMCTWKEAKINFLADRNIIFLTLSGGYRDVYICQNLPENLKYVHFIVC